jgi:hypothetical protein
MTPATTEINKYYRFEATENQCRCSVCTETTRLKTLCRFQFLLLATGGSESDSQHSRMMALRLGFTNEEIRGWPVVGEEDA